MTSFRISSIFCDNGEFMTGGIIQYVASNNAGQVYINNVPSITCSKGDGSPDRTINIEPQADNNNINKDKFTAYTYEIPKCSNGYKEITFIGSNVDPVTSNFSRMEFTCREDTLKQPGVGFNQYTGGGGSDVNNLICPEGKVFAGMRVGYLNNNIDPNTPSNFWRQIIASPDRSCIDIP